MKFLVVTLVSSLLGLAHCKPQYNYPAPAPSIPSGSYGTPSGIGGGQISGGSSFVNAGGFGGGGSQGFTGGSGFGGGGGSAIGGGGFTGGSGIGGGGSQGFTGGSVIGGGGYTGGSSGTLVQKHIYVHVAPPEPEEFKQQQQISLGQATKHYKIIFIKAPSYPTPTAPSIQALQQNQEKTLVYVLVKRPEDAAEISVPTVAPTAPSKPEVYFIRYKAKSEVTGGGSAGISTGGAGISTGGAGISTGGAGISTGGSSGTQTGLYGAPNVGDVRINVNSASSTVSKNYGPPGQSGPY